MTEHLFFRMSMCIIIPERRPYTISPELDRLTGGDKTLHGRNAYGPALQGRIGANAGSQAQASPPALVPHDVSQPRTSRRRGLWPALRNRRRKADQGVSRLGRGDGDEE